MNTQERIQLRNEIFIILKETSSLIKCKGENSYRISNNKFLHAYNNNINNLQEKYDLYINEFRTENEAKYCLLYFDDYINHLCPVCNNICLFYKTKKKNIYKKTCGNKECIEKLANSKEAKEKSKKTCLEKYGAEHQMQSKEIQDKAKKTNLEKYGTEYTVQNKEIQEKSKKTIIEIYGVDNVFKSEEIKDIIRESNIEKYGVENPMQNKDIKKKAIKTFKETHIKKYTFNNPIIDDEINNFINNVKEYYKDNNIELYNIYSIDEYFIKFIEIISTHKNRLLRLREIAKIFNVGTISIKKRLEKLNLLNYFFIKDSNLELQFKELLDNNNIQYIRHYRGLYNSITNSHWEIDFLINHNIGIEINDIDSHNINNKNINYHYNKTLKAKEYNIRLIHIWEWELINDELWNKLSDWIINLCNNDKIKIGARKTIIKKIPENIEKEFLNKYHLQGYVKSEKCYGLYYNEELIQIMAFCKARYNKNYQWELLRLCTKYGYTIIGGAQKLLKNFTRDYNPTSIISYCDLDKFTGKIYEELGFRLLKKNQPSPIWYDEETGKYFSQLLLLKLGADKLLKTNFGKNTNNEEIAYKSGYEKVYNCGINVYVYKK